MDHVKNYEIPAVEIGGLERKQVFGKGGYIEFGDATMSYIRVDENVTTDIRKAECETVFYVRGAKGASVACGDTADSLDTVTDISADDVFVVDAADYCAFITKGDGSYIELTELMADPDAVINFVKAGK